MKQTTIKNKHITLSVIDYGAIIQEIIVKDKDGNDTNVVVGFEDPTDYLNDNAFLGACVGRYAGRISNGGFSLNDKKYTIKSVDGVHLHGGNECFSKKYWTIEEVNESETPFIKLSYLSKDLEEGYPGNLKATVTYKLIDNALEITHEATTDKTTVINLTNHSYFRLDDAKTVNQYHLQLNCSNILETHENLLPTGNLSLVKGTKYDFLSSKMMGETRLDTPFVIDSDAQNTSKVFSEKTGISLEVNTNQPAMVIYTPADNPSICFETQNYPDAPNIPSFPSSILNPEETYLNKSVFRFGLVN